MIAGITLTPARAAALRAAYARLTIKFACGDWRTCRADLDVIAETLNMTTQDVLDEFKRAADMYQTIPDQRTATEIEAVS